VVAQANSGYLLDIQDKPMNKIMLALATGPSNAEVNGQGRELLDILTGLASFEGRALRLTMVSYS
jgi:hypothetical protein